MIPPPFASFGDTSAFGGMVVPFFVIYIRLMITPGWSVDLI